MKTSLLTFIAIIIYSCCFPQQSQSNLSGTIRQLYSSYIEAEDKGDVNKLTQIQKSAQLFLQKKSGLSSQDQAALYIIDGDAWLEKGEYATSLPLLQKADSLCASAFATAAPEALQAKRILSWSYGYNGHPELERKLSYDLLNIYSSDQQKNILEIADLYHTIGFNFGNESNRPEEQKLYKQGLNLMENFTPQTPVQKQGKLYILGLIYNSLSISQYASNQYEAALQHARTSLYYRNQFMAGSPQLATNLMIIGRCLYQTEGNVDSALLYLDRAIALLEKKDEHGNSMRGGKYWVLYKGYKADILQRANLIDGAIQEMQSLISFLQRNKSPEAETGLIPGYCSLSAAYLQKGDTKAALSVMQTLKHMLDKDPTLAKLLQVKMNTQYAVALHRANKDDSAAIVFDDVIRRTGLSLPQLEQDSFSIPVTFPFEFFSVYVQAADAITGEALSAHNSAQLLRGVNMFRNVIAALQARQAWYFEAGVEENIGSEDMNVYEKLLNVLYEARGMMAEPQRMHYAFDAIESAKANLLKAGLEQDQHFSALSSPEENRKRIDLKTAMYAAMKKSNEQAVSGLQDSLVKAKERYLTYLQWLKKKYPFASNSNHYAVAEDNSFLLRYKGTILNYFLGNQHLYSFVHQDGKRMFTRKPMIAHLDEMIALLRQKHERDSDSFFAASHALYNWLLGNNKITDGLVIIPHKQLSLISFDMLATEKQASSITYLIEKCPVRYAYSAGLLASPKSMNTDGKAMHYFGGFAASQFNNAATSQWMAMNSTGNTSRDNTSPLMGTEKEVNAIAGIMDGDKYLHTKPDNFLTQAPQYHILHIATHAFADDDDQHQCHLLFEADSVNNSVVSGDEIASLPIHAEVAVLSACNTGTGKMNSHEGIISLGRSFFIAGCPSVVMSLWSVNDESTAEIMTAFYKHLQEGELKDEALRNAKLDYISQQTNAAKKDPYYWAGFVVVGDNSALQSNSVMTIAQWAVLIAAIVALVGAFLFYFRRRSSRSLT